MRDIDIRRALRAMLNKEHREDPETLIVDELGLCQGRARVDVAVVNGTLHGYEIKSERDTLERLPAQAAIYSAALNRVTVVASPCHISTLEATVPPWWGIQHAADTGSGDVKILDIRPALDNPEVNPAAVAQLLWRDEALEALDAKGLAEGLKSKPRRVLWQALAANLTVEELCCLVRQTLTHRPADWRVDARQT